MKKILLWLWDKFIDHILGVILTLLVIPFVLEFWTKFKPISLWVIPFLAWRWTGWIFVAIILMTGYIFWGIKNRADNKQRISVRAIQPAPKYHASFDRKIHEGEYAGVIWKILVGVDVEPLKSEVSRESVRVWPFPRPFCPKCDYELERKKSRWYCMPCNKNYQIPRNLRENTWEKIRRNYQRFVVQWGWNNFGIKETQKPFNVELREIKKRKSKRSKK